MPFSVLYKNEYLNGVNILRNMIQDMCIDKRDEVEVIYNYIVIRGVKYLQVKGSIDMLNLFVKIKA